jgi:succinyl-diaminopimelate desuccinylase
MKSDEDDMTDPLTLATHLIALRTDAGNAQALDAAMDLVVAALGGFTIEHFEREGSRSLLAYVGPTRPERFGVLLNGHVDVIPGNPSLYQATIDGDRLSGVGSVDMKANLAVLIDVFCLNARQTRFPLGLQIVSDEELGGFNGTRYQMEHGVLADVVLSGETTQFDIIHQAKGIAWYRCHIPGTTAHGAYPWRGDNALLIAQQFIARMLTRFPIPAPNAWVTTVNVAGIDTHNFAFNKVPDAVTVSLDVRFIPADRDTLALILQELLPADGTFEQLVDESPLDTPADHPALHALKTSTEAVLGKPVAFRAAMGSSDARHYAQTGAACIEYGPFGTGIASDDEHTSIAGLRQYSTILERFLRGYVPTTNKGTER